MKQKFHILFALLLAFVFTAAAGVATTGVALAQDDETGIVTVVHGVPGLTVDVYVNGALTLPDFAPGTITDPLTLPAGDYDIVIVPAGGDPAAPAIAATVTLPAGANASIVAHLTEDGAPTLTTFVNDTSAIEAGNSRVTVRHTAAAPAVDVSLIKAGMRDPFVLENLTNPNEAQADVPSGNYKARIFAAGTDQRVFSPVRAMLEANTSYIIYAIGSLGDGSFGLLIQTIALDTQEFGFVTVVHGVPGLTVDVYVNGALALPDFEPYTVTDPLRLPAGDYDIAIVPAGGDPADPAIAGSTTLPANANASIVAHLTEEGAPTLSVFVNDISELNRQTARLVVRHTAAVIPVDVDLLDRRGNVLGTLENLANPEEAQVEVPRGKYFATLSPAGSDDVAVGPALLKLRGNTVTIVYAVGSLADGTFQLLTQTIPLWMMNNVNSVPVDGQIMPMPNPVK